MINLKNLRNDATNYYLAIDISMIVLVLVNLGWIIFDWLFTVPWVQLALNWVYPPFVEFYGKNIHENFYNYDLIFVAIFFTEFLFGWSIAIVRREYRAWWHYPFFHWYDLLGCIPVGTFRFLRVLRLVSIVVRLQRLGVLDVSDTAVYKFGKRYYDIFVEEVSDRVVVNVLDGVKDEISHGSMVQDRLVNDVLLPRKASLSQEIVSRVEVSTQELLGKHRHAVRDYIHGVITRAMKANPELKLVGYVPLLGGAVNKQLDHAVGNIVANVVEQIISDLGSDTVHNMVENYVDAILTNVMHQPTVSGLDIKSLSNDVIELLKDQVKVQRWREEEEALAQSDKSQA